MLFAFEIIQFPSSLGNHKLTQIAKVVIKICEHEVCVPGLLGVPEAQGSPVGGYSDFCIHCILYSLLSLQAWENREEGPPVVQELASSAMI